VASELQVIRERLEELERENRWLKRVGLAALLLEITKASQACFLKPSGRRRLFVVFVGASRFHIIPKIEISVPLRLTL